MSKILYLIARVMLQSSPTVFTYRNSWSSKSKEMNCSVVPGKLEASTAIGMVGARTAKLSAHWLWGGSQESTQIQNEALKAKILKCAGTGQAWRNAHRAKNPLSSQDSDFEKVSILLTTTKPTLDAFMKPPESRRQMLVSPFKAAYIQAEKTEIETHIKNGTWELIDPATLENSVRTLICLAHASRSSLQKCGASF